MQCEGTQCKFISSTRGKPIRYVFVDPEPYMTIDREFLKSELKFMVEKSIEDGGDVEILSGEYMRAIEVDPRGLTLPRVL